MKPASSSAAPSMDLNQNQAYKIPIAHGEGRFFASDDTLKSIQDNDQVLFHYCDEQASITDESNPNGSIHSIAGITNKNKNVFGMMPHPERATNPALNNTDGVQVFELLGLLKTAAAL